MSEFIVSARKYRPSTFKSVVGQHSITSTLKNALTSGKMGHAYLFTGPRGVGKTSCARIFAKTINCFNLTDDHEPCNECESCASFNENRSYNIHELDAASNNSVDDIRLLTEKVRIKPQLGEYSVYIIDEVHMLSTAAFNAFLKTLEEPPEHAIFILATTEKHKILPTILSRCQIFDFNRITVEDAAGHLAYVAGQEGVKAEAEALTVIAHKADGGMRDALSMFDQIVSFSGGEVTYEKVIENLNVLDYEYYFKLIESLFAGDITGSLLVFNDVLEKGFDGHHFITGLSSHLRDLLVCKDEATLKLLEVGASIRERYKEQAKLCSVAWLFRAIEQANKTDLNYKVSQNKRLQVELALMQIAQLNNKLQVEATAQPQASSQAQPAASNSTQAAPAVQEQKAQYAATAKKPQEEARPQPTEAPQATKPVQTEQPAARRGARDSSLSISALRKQTGNSEEPQAEKEQEAAKTEPDPVLGNETVDTKGVQDAWMAFADTFVKSPRMRTFFETNKPELLEGNVVEVKVNNKLQRESLEAQLDKLQSFMRQQLRNGSVSIAFKEVAQVQQKVFTQEDKLKFLIEKNPQMMTLKNKFNLDFS